MKEIKLIVSQEKLQQNRIKTLENDRIKCIKKATKKNYKRQEKIVNIAKQTIAILLLVMLMIWGLYLGQNLKKTGYTNCIDNGYSEAYCLKNS